MNLLPAQQSLPDGRHARCPSRLNFWHQVRLFHVSQFNFELLSCRLRSHPLARLLAGSAEIECQSALTKALQPSLEVLIPVQRLPGHHLQAASREALEIRGPRQFAVEPG